MRTYDPKKLSYQPKIDPTKVLRYSELMKAGEVFPPVRLRRMPNGSLRVMDGSHRALARAMIGERVEGYVEGEG